MYVGEPINTEKLIENVPKSQQLDTLHAAIEGAVKALELEARSKKCK